ncbi:aggrecan core protein-like [Glandiceps talaboti]
MKFLVLAVHTILISLSVEGGEIFHSDGGQTYTLNFEEAKQECAKYNAVIGTYDQLYEAWEEGFQKCRAGWLNDGNVQYPMQMNIGGCGNFVGLVNVGYKDKSSSYNVFCYKDTPSTSIVGGEIFHSNGVGRYTLNYEQAKKECTKYNAVIATYNQLHEAWENGLEECSAGWLRDGSVRYPMHTVLRSCGSSIGVVDWGFKDKSATYDVYCFKYIPSASTAGEIPITSIVGGGIIHSNGGTRYSLNYGQAKEECTKYNAVIATHDQLYEAWENGLQKCLAGWLRDGSVQYPMREALGSCGGTITVVDWGFKNKLDRYDVYCYREIPTTSIIGEVFLVRESATARYELTFSEAELECKKYDAVLATHEQLEEGWLRGLGYCSAGWLADGTVEYPMQYERSGCGSKAGIIVMGYRDKTNMYDAYCYRDVTPKVEGAVTFHVESREGQNQLTLAEAIKECQKHDAEIATVAQLYDAWEQGMGICQAGWLSNGQLGFPSQEVSELCGNAIGIVKPASESNFEKHDVFCYRVGEIFHSDGGKHKSLNYEQATKECTKYNAAIATYDHLYQAWKDGFHRCQAGWLKDRSVQYSMQEKIRGCGNLVGIISWGLKNKLDTYDVYCYKDTPSTSIVGGKIFHSNGVEHYSLNYEQAKKECTKYNAVIATYDQLHEAWENGLQQCDAGWLRDGSVQYPMQKEIVDCGNLVGIVDLGFENKSHTYDVYCYKDVPATSIVGGKIIRSNGLRRYSLNYEEAKEECTKYNAVIATYDQLYEAWENGFQSCQAGWLRDGSVRYPMQEEISDCGNLVGVVDLGVKDKSDTYDVYCYKDIPSTSIVGEVFIVREPGPNRYQLTFNESDSACTRYDAVLATREQLEEAWLRGLGYCSPGWLADGSVVYQTQYERKGCDGEITSYGYPDMQELYDAYCYRAVAQNQEGKVAFHVESTNGRYHLTFAEAIKECQKYDAEIATLAQLYGGWKQGLGICRAGWISSGQIRSPSQEASEFCGNAIGIITPVSRGFFEKYDVFCYGVPATTTSKREIITEAEVPELPVEDARE